MELIDNYWSILCFSQQGISQTQFLPCYLKVKFSCCGMRFSLVFCWEIFHKFMLSVFNYGIDKCEQIDFISEMTVLCIWILLTIKNVVYYFLIFLWISQVLMSYFLSLYLLQFIVLISTHRSLYNVYFILISTS